MQYRTQLPKVAEFFAGIGLVRKGLEPEGFNVVFANDIDRTKKKIYEANGNSMEFALSDIRELSGYDVPQVELAVASFPCTDLSVAGARAGLGGRYSSLVNEFLRIVEEMRGKRPKVVVLENVLGFATSRGGSDLFSTIEKLNSIGYVCDILVLDAARFVPQSRPRIFVVAWTGRPTKLDLYFASDARPPWTLSFRERNPDLGFQTLNLPPLPHCSETLADVVERIIPEHPAWWPREGLDGFSNSLSAIQHERLETLKSSDSLRWATAYRRTRQGKAVWEIRGDSISGCLRTGRGGSSRQAVVEAGCGDFRVRWMTAREYCRLQGAPDLDLAGVSENQGRFALGDAVCVPVVSWLAKNILLPLLSEGNIQASVENSTSANYA